MPFHWEERAFCVDVDFESSEKFGVLNANKSNQLIQKNLKSGLKTSEFEKN